MCSIRPPWAPLAQILTSHRQGLPLLIEGEGVFSVGGDIAELAAFATSDARHYSQLGQDVVDCLESWPGVTIARLAGYALGTGLELALGCDVLVGVTDLRVGLPGLAWALVPCLGGLRRLSCRLSSALCSELFLGGEVLEAEQALGAGLLNRISDDPLAALRRPALATTRARRSLPSAVCASSARGASTAKPRPTSSPSPSPPVNARSGCAACSPAEPASPTQTAASLALTWFTTWAKASGWWMASSLSCLRSSRMSTCCSPAISRL